MTGLDTNVLVRYLTQDDPVQSRKANAIIAGAVDRGEPCPINAIVLCELVWVLREAYRLDKPTVIATLEKVLDTAQLVVEQADLARRALDDYCRGRGDFADYLIGWRNRQAGCSDTATFDRALRRSVLFRVL
ncbi:MAG: type II toxin-antitoxin system VapC family toxin [Candidatus Rokubacteria bacterium]|nr:type II toxin-antitoxin system VapC family toxin [Candidatus Rokubacteria bacterium]MBI4256152.1 type II toxin-antitoxin system VapC family toxin [Candidatus Rokubacteria bacterium]